MSVTAAFRLAAVLCLTLLAACPESPPPFRSTALPGADWGKDFTLTSHRGERFDTASLRGKVQVLFVTVDPDHDTPKQLAMFLSAFDPAFIGLTGKAGELMAVAREHKIYAEGTEGTIVHSGNLLVKDTRGRLRLVIPESATVEDIVHDLRLLLRS